MERVVMKTPYEIERDTIRLGFITAIAIIIIIASAVILIKTN